MWLVVVMVKLIPYKLFLTNTQVVRHGIAFANNSLANIKFAKSLLSKMVQ